MLRWEIVRPPGNLTAGLAEDYGQRALTHSSLKPGLLSGTVVACYNDKEKYFVADFSNIHFSEGTLRMEDQNKIERVRKLQIPLLLLHASTRTISSLDSGSLCETSSYNDLNQLPLRSRSWYGSPYSTICP